jgi:hypothetical protein
MFFEDLVIPKLIDIAIDLNDVLLHLLNQVLQLFQIVFVDVTKAVGLELLHSLIAQPIHYLVNLLPLRRVVGELLPENLLVFLQCPVECCCPFVFCDLLPGRFDVWNAVCVECFNVALNHGGNCRASDHLSLIGLGACISQDQIS